MPDAAEYEVVMPIADDLLVEAVAVAMHTRRARLSWSDCHHVYREEKRDEARAAIAVMLRHFIRLEGAVRHGHRV